VNHRATRPPCDYTVRSKDLKRAGHPAPFPVELPKRCIKLFSYVGDTVLDPFLGSGTTSLAAKKLGRNSVGCEINADFLPLIKEKLGIRQKMIFERSDFEIIRQNISDIDFKELVTKLPYTFKDPIKFDKKVDPRKLRFGSKIGMFDSKSKNSQMMPIQL